MTKKILITITDQQSEATGPLVEATGEKSLSHLVRRLLAEEARRVDSEWPDNFASTDETIKKAQAKRWTKPGQSA